MKKTITLILVIALITTLANAQDGNSEKIKGNGNIVSKIITTEGYEKIKVSGFFDVELIAGEEGQITIKGEENLLDFIEIKVTGNELKIGTEKGKRLSTSKGNSVFITVPFKTLNEVSLAGSGDINTKNKITANQFTTSLSGSGDIKLELEATDVTAKLTGSGDIVLKGKSENFHCQIVGSGDLTASELVSSNVDSTITGSGDCKVYCSDFLEARVTGSGDLNYLGDPKKKETKVTGSGSISKA
jgi:Putative auto-transporter adhesin, head GIN domain